MAICGLAHHIRQGFSKNRVMLTLIWRNLFNRELPADPVAPGLQLQLICAGLTRAFFSDGTAQAGIRFGVSAVPYPESAWN